MCDHPAGGSVAEHLSPVEADGSVTRLVVPVAVVIGGELVTGAEKRLNTVSRINSGLITFTELRLRPA